MTRTKLIVSVVSFITVVTELNVDVSSGVCVVRNGLMTSSPYFSLQPATHHDCASSMLTWAASSLVSRDVEAPMLKR